MLTVLSVIIPVFFVVLCGYVYACFEKPDMQVINRMIMQLLAPALVFSVMSSKDFEIAIYSNIAFGGAAIVLFTGLVGYIVAKFFNYQWRTIVPPMMFRNWGNLGIPLTVFALGESSLNVAVILFLVGNVMHFSLGIVLLSGRFNILEFIKTPVIIAMVLGLVVNLNEVVLPLALTRPIDMIGQTAIPMMLVSLGVRLQFVRWNDFSMALFASVLAPGIGILCAVIISSLFNFNPLETKQLLIFAALNLLSIIVYFILLYVIL